MHLRQREEVQKVLRAVKKESEPTDPMSHRDSTVSIPPSMRGRLIITLPVSGCLGQGLLHAGYWRLGELHGLRYADFLECSHVGPKTVSELRDLVGRILRSEFIKPRPVRRGGVVHIPPEFRDRLLVEFAFSNRSINAFAKVGFSRMGDLHGKEWRRLYVLRGFGPPSGFELMDVISELELRANPQTNTGQCSGGY